MLVARVVWPNVSNLERMCLIDPCCAGITSLTTSCFYVKADRERKKREMQGLTGDAPPAAAPVQAAPVVAPRSYDEAKIQVRLTNGKTLVQVILKFQ